MTTLISASPGQYWNDEKQSWYNYFRDYDATTGRYLPSDPLGLFDGPNTYGYVYSNPVNYVDPTGEFAWGILLGAGNLAWQLYQNGGDIRCVKWKNVAMWGLGGLGASLGAKIGWQAGGKYVKGSGMNFSHMIPARAGNSRLFNNKFGKWFLQTGNKWNGRYVTRERHYKHDSYYYGNIRGDRQRRLNEWGQ